MITTMLHPDDTTSVSEVKESESMKFGVYRNIELQMEILHLRYIFHDGIQKTENKDGT